jgi:UV DNA damage repair endonuclease
MELAIRPTDLYAASVALASCADRLDDAAITFSRQAAAELPEIGTEAAEAARRGLIAADRAVQIISTDIERLAQALAALAHHYQRVDATAVPGR